MTTARVLFLAKYRVPHACMSLQFDHFLEGIDVTVIASPLPKSVLWSIFKKYNIDTTTFEYVSDHEVLPLYPQIENWLFNDDYRGPWLRQQAIKLSFLDHLNYDVMLMQDPDTFLIEPYRCYNNGRLNCMVLPNERHSYGYYKVLENALGITRQTEHCFVTEFVPVLKDDITAMKHTLEQRHNKHWLDAIIDNVPLENTIPPWQRYEGEQIRWFSEYEFVGNWAMSRHEIDFTFQRRFEYNTMEGLRNLTRDYNSVADAVPDLSLSLQYDWDSNQVVDFDYYMDIVTQRLNQ
jgi:hypothetical protein